MQPQPPTSHQALLASYRAVSRSGDWFFRVPIVLIVIAVLCDLGKFGVEGVSVILFTFVSAALALTSVVLMVYTGFRLGAQMRAFFRTLSDADLEALLLMPAKEKIWTSGVRVERDRRAEDRADSGASATS